MLWAPRHQLPVFFLLLALVVLALFRWSTRTATAPAPGTAGGQAEKSGLKLDPNTAPEHELAAVPGIGNSRARAIVHARKNGQVFRSLTDLDSLPRFGESALETAGPFLAFPE